MSVATTTSTPTATASTTPLIDDTCSKLLNEMLTKLRRRQLTGSFHTATATVAMLRRIVASAAWRSVDDLIHMLKDAGRQLMRVKITEFVIGNMVRRVLFIIVRGRKKKKITQPHNISSPLA
jgi:translation initiation factor eIF-2B subunit beta